MRTDFANWPCCVKKSAHLRAVCVGCSCEWVVFASGVWEVRACVCIVCGGVRGGGGGKVSGWPGCVVYEGEVCLSES
jgi:hypothetical protein